MRDDGQTDPFLDELFRDEVYRSDGAKRRYRAEEEERYRARIILAARHILSTDSGRRFLFWLLNQTGVFAHCFTGNSTTFFLEGKRSIGLEIYRLLLEADPNAFQALIDFQRNDAASSPARYGMQP